MPHDIPRSLTAERLRDEGLSALSLLTRLPVPGHRPAGAASAWAWPLVGLALGGLAAGAAGLAQALGAGPGPAAAVALVVGAGLTGALHEDGLADTADGLLGGRTPERRLEIMKDSRIGSYGALALMLVTLAAWSALTEWVALGTYWVVLPAAAALSRAPMAVVMAALPPARPGGFSRAVGQPSAGVAAVSAGVALLLALALCGWSAFLAAGVIAGLVTLLARAAQRAIGGQTGDILGASQQVAFAAALALLG